MKLVKFSDNWADEMDLNGWKIMTDEKYFTFVEEIQNRKTEFSVYFGTNEDNIYSNGETFLRKFRVTDISHEEVEVLIKFFGDEYGMFPDPRQRWEEDKEWEESHPESPDEDDLYNSRINFDGRMKDPEDNLLFTGYNYTKDDQNYDAANRK